MELQNTKLDMQVFERALRKQLLNKNVIVLKVTENSLSEKGLNFLSDLYKVDVRYKIVTKNNNEIAESEKTSSMFIKVEPSNKLSKDMCQQQSFCLTEMRILRDVLPQIEELVGCQFGPKLYYSLENPTVLIMENLLERGFFMKDRQKGLPFEHCRLVVERIAKLHAGSVAFFEKDPKLIESFKDGGITTIKCPRSYFRLMEVSLLRIADQVRKWSNGEYSAAADKLLKLEKTIAERCMDVYNYDEDEFCVLNHGDCWTNNEMFVENENGEPTDFLLVDYQMAVYSSPAIDLIYFLNICPEFEIKYDNDDYFLTHYLNTLSDTMKSIGCKKKPPTMEELKKAIDKRRIYTVFSGIILCLRMIANKEDTEDFNEVFGQLSGETKINVFKNPDAIKLAQKMIPIMNERGYLD
ncbi:uncharacterized protein LOC108632987 [Ceratina calcarata]|uniref:Uncharacterized protein LOC108632987 n=1 Tax=Ceratina calcarata TaxID=156304 RepID=A0AAJ7JIE7_9HYME|nr:uncharacterized protein LOC108632987 [Ceratina calcarata]XP_026666767.1 uncharacterized protein LOC108632987 [Ceratina calcarata]